MPRASLTYGEARLARTQATYPTDGFDGLPQLTGHHLDAGLHDSQPFSTPLLLTTFDANAQYDASFGDDFSTIQADWIATRQMHTSLLKPMRKPGALSRTGSKSKAKPKREEAPHVYIEGEDEQLRTDYDVEVPRPARRFVRGQQYGR